MARSTAENLDSVVLGVAPPELADVDGRADDRFGGTGAVDAGGRWSVVDDDDVADKGGGRLDISETVVAKLVEETP